MEEDAQIEGQITDYDAQVTAINTTNEVILTNFEKWLMNLNLSRKTIRDHVQNIEFFGTFLVYYEPLKRLEETTSADIYSFLSSWFPSKALWASANSVKLYLASFKKFFSWMGKTNQMHPDTIEAILKTLKADREEFLESVDTYWDMVDNLKEFD